MLQKTWISNDPIQTKQIAQRLAEHIHDRTIITLQGDLGSGKTTFTQGLAKGLGITKNVNSPTFTISKIYEGRLDLIHIDAYRLENESSDLGFEEFFDMNMVSVIEWPKYISDILPLERIDIMIEILDETSRRFTFTYDTIYTELLEVIQ